MQPIILTNAFLRPRATRLSSKVTLSEDTNVYACVEEMISVIRENLGATPLMLPTAFDEESIAVLLHHVDGIMLPGAASNIHPSQYGSEIKETAQIFDKEHDAADMFLIRQARKQGIPFFGICRSMQAVNIAFGGTLLQKLENQNDIDHMCSDPCEGHDDAPTYMHNIYVEEGGTLAHHFQTRILSINSIHEQAIDKLGYGLRVEARAPDGVIEAISYPAAPNFFVAVQWHPEALPKNTVSQKLFQAFRADVEERFHQRHRQKRAE